MEENRLSHINYSGEERRKYKRFPFVFPIKYTYLGSSLENPRPSEFSLYSFSNNISRGGMLLMLSNNVPPGEFLDLVVTLPVEHEVISIQAKGLVKWVKKEKDGYLAGIEFADIKEIDLAIIQKLIDTDAF